MKVGEHVWRAVAAPKDVFVPYLWEYSLAILAAADVTFFFWSFLKFKILENVIYDMCRFTKDTPLAYRCLI